MMYTWISNTIITVDKGYLERICCWHLLWCHLLRGLDTSISYKILLMSLNTVKEYYSIM